MPKRKIDEILKRHEQMAIEMDDKKMN